MASYSDSFTYSDGQLSTVSSGVWVNRNASIDVVSGQYYENSGSVSNGWSEVNTTTADFTDDHEAQIVASTLNTFDALGPVVRSSASGCYCISVDGTAGSTRRVCRMDGTTKVVVGSVNITPVNGDTLKLRVVGSTITAYVNGSLVDTITDSTYTTGQPGIFYNRGGTGLSRGDTFSASDITSGPSIIRPATIIKSQRATMSGS